MTLFVSCAALPEGAPQILTSCSPEALRVLNLLVSPALILIFLETGLKPGPDLSVSAGGPSEGGHTGGAAGVAASSPAGGRRAALGGRAALLHQPDAEGAGRPVGQTRAPSRSPAGGPVSGHTWTQSDAETSRSS